MLPKGALCVRELLEHVEGHTQQQKKIGTHSLKCTILSWMSKAGAPEHLRSIAGYHVGRSRSTVVLLGHIGSSAAFLQEHVALISKREVDPVEDFEKTTLFSTASRDLKGRLKGGLKGASKAVVQFIAIGTSTVESASGGSATEGWARDCNS